VNPDFDKRLRRLLAASSLFDKTIDERTRRSSMPSWFKPIKRSLSLQNVFDGAKLTPEQFALTRAEIMAACFAGRRRIARRRFRILQKISKCSRGNVAQIIGRANASGAWVGEKFDPFKRVWNLHPAERRPLSPPR